MRLSEIAIGETYLLPVVATEVTEYGNMVRLVTEDDGEVVYAHTEALLPSGRAIDPILVRKGERNVQQ